MATDNNFVVKNGLEVGGALIVNSSGQLVVATVSSNIKFQDNVKAQFGASSDLQIYHDGGNSYIDESGTGNLILKGGGSILLKSTDNENMITATGNSAVTLYYDGSSRLTTKSDGVDITGELQADTLDIDGNADISGTINSGAITAPSINNTATITFNSTGNNPTVTLNRYSGQPSLKAGTDDSGYLIMDSSGGVAALNWYTSNNVILAFGGGNVGIADNTPSQRLDVNGNIGIGGTEIITSSRNLTNIGTISSGEITTTAPQFKYVSNTDSNVGLLIRDATYISNEADITATRLATGSNLTLGLAGQEGINAYIGGVNKFSINSSGNATFAGTINSGAITATGIDAGGNIEADAMFINTPDAGGSPATTAILKIHGYEGRGAGIKIRDSANSASGASDREWFIGSGYAQSGFNIGYASDGSQSSYSAQNKLSIDTSGNATFAGTINSGGITSSAGITANGPFKSGGSNNYILFDYDGDFTGGNYYAIQDTSANRLRISYGFSATDNLELDSSGNFYVNGGNATFAGTVEATSFSDGTISGITFIDEDSFATNSATRVPTQQSIKAYVDAQVAGVVDSAPAALDTLNELAAALGDDANFSTTTSTALGNRLRVDTAAQGLTGTQQANAITNLGITATKAELNYVDGVTSNIQTQLDGKQPSGSYLTGNQTITLSGDVSGSGTTSISVTVADDSHNHVISNIDGLQTALDAKLTSSSGLNASNLTSGTVPDARIAASSITQHTDSKYLRSDVSDIYAGRTLSFGIVGNGTNTSGSFFSIEGNTDSTGEGSGRIFFREHNSSTAAEDSYGMSLGYRGGSADITTAGGSTNQSAALVSNGQWFMVGHDSSNQGALIMYGDRAATFVDFSSNNVRGIGTLTAASATITGLSTQSSETTVLTIDGSNVVGKRDLGSNAFNSTSYLPLAGGTMTGDIIMGANQVDFNAGGGNSTSPQIIGDRSTTDLDSRVFTTEGGLSYTTFESSTLNKPSHVSNNANGVITINTHTGSYNHQLAFTNKGNIAHRSRDGSGLGAWKNLLTDFKPNAPSITSTTTVNETIEIVFAASTSADQYAATSYEVWSDGGTGSDYSLIAKIPETDIASSMSVIDSSFDTDGTIAYRIYAIRHGIYSTAATTTHSFTMPSLDVSNMSVIPDINNYHIQYDLPDTRFLDHIEIYVDAEAVSGNLTRVGAILAYSGDNPSFTYNISSSDLDKYHQFWVEVVTV